MNILEKIKNLFKGIGIFIIVYIIISGNGDDTFFAWILMLVSLVLTMLFLDETTNKVVLSVITVLLGAICFRGFIKAIPGLLLIVALLSVCYFWGCKGDISEFEKKIKLVLCKGNNQINRSNWQRNVQASDQALLWTAFNILNPFERYYYYGGAKRRLVIKKGIFPLRKINRYSLGILVDTITNMGQEEIFWYSVWLPVKHEAKAVKAVELKHVSRRKIKVLDEIINGK